MSRPEGSEHEAAWESDAVTSVRVTHVGGPTTLIEVGGWRLLTDPTFDPPGRRYSFGWGTSSRKVAGPAVTVDELPPLDAVLLTHDHHADNLDDAGRALLASVGTVHYEGWSHFRQGRDAIEPAFTAAPAEVRDSVRWLEIGEATDVEV